MNKDGSITVWLIGKWLMLVAVGLLCAACQNLDGEQKFDWSATLSAPEEYPVQVYKGAVIAKGYQQSLAGFGDVDDGWGNDSGIVVMGPDLKNLPSRLEVSWHSFVDQKNFEGAWDLPKEDIAKFIKQGFMDTSAKKKYTYNTFVIGLAPNGLVVVWLSGVGRQIEIAHFKAQEVFVGIDDVPDSNKPVFSKKYNDVVLSQLNDEFNTFERRRVNDYPKVDLYEYYRTRYSWRPDVQLADSYSVDDYVLQTYNGEVEIASAKNEGNSPLGYKGRGILKSFAFSWVDENHNKIATCWLEAFDEKELVNAYSQFESSEQLDLVVQGVETKSVLLVLKSGAKEVEIQRFKVTIE